MVRLFTFFRKNEQERKYDFQSLSVKVVSFTLWYRSVGRYGSVGV